MRTQSPKSPSPSLRTSPTQRTLGLTATPAHLTPMEMAIQYGFERHQRVLSCQI